MLAIKLPDLDGLRVVDARSTVGPGRAHPLGASVSPEGVNFSVYSRSALKLDLLLFEHEDDAQPARTVPIDPAANRTNHYWHVFVKGAKSGQLYGYRAAGPFDPAEGMRFNSAKVLLDPYGRCVAVPGTYSRDAARGDEDNCATAMKSIVVDLGAYDWEGDTPLQRPASKSIIYEMHVRGFTRNPNSGVPESTRGTYAGLIAKIPYLQKLGVTAVELLPVFQFDAQDALPGHTNYWGYAPVSFFAPHRSYSSRQDPLGPIDEFRDMVKALHRAGIEVILDVVFNHTAEGNQEGPTLCFRGFENSAYYILEGDKSRYANYTGTGNTLNGNHPIVRRMIVDSLRYWVEEMHVDGFRFDLASILDRGESGELLPNPPVLWYIDSEPALAGTKLIAEAWDAAGLYQVGSFVGHSWREWNGRFRDDVRSFFRGEDGFVGPFSDRLLGSPQIYAHKGREPEASVNFITCHDGFTINDLVSYKHKHNEANGEHNRDGSDENRSDNFGVEGPTDELSVEELRNRQAKNFFAVTMLSLGLPMILMGDEVRRTQFGNNNAYCLDDETSWFDWALVARHADLHRFVRLIAAHRLTAALSQQPRDISLHELLRSGDRTWHGVRIGEPDWTFNSHSLALRVACPLEGLLLYLIFNAYWEPLEFELPSGPWHRWIDTSLDSPFDISEWPDAPPVSGGYRSAPHSVVALYSPIVGPHSSE